ncbi:MAG: cell filamentation protein Fic, partial [Gammaproteobacteria bacterium]|nr:cell filamentation protein Fic [Gammaproteobacteria bacterium]
GVINVHTDSLGYYQYIDYTQIAEYLFDCIKTTINTDFKDELRYIANYDKTKQAIQDVIDMPDKEIDNIIKFIMQNNSKLSTTKQKRYFPLLTNKEIAAIEDIVEVMYGVRSGHETSR